MKKSNGSLVIAVVAGIWLATAPAFADTIEIVSDVWCPYNCAQDAADPGYTIKIAQKVFGSAGHQVVYKTLNWSRAIVQAREGKSTAIAGTGRADAPDFVFPEEPVGSSVSTFFVTADSSWNYAGPGSLAAVKLGFIKDYKYGEELDKYIAANQNSDKLQAASGDDALEKNINKLLAKRIDVLVEDANVFMPAAKKNGCQDKVKAAGNIKPIPVYIAFSPGNPKSQEYAQILSRGIQQLRASGELATILKKYGMSDWK
jgi:polar amino acid transport system substrate-binding protein